MYYILDKNNKPIKIDNVLEWAKWFEGGKQNKRRVGFDVINGTTISTVFLGMDYGFGKDHVPILWETMCFSPNGDYDGYTERYPSHEGAVSGHNLCVKAVEKGYNLNRT